MTELSIGTYSIALLIDIFSIALLAYLVYFRRYRNREMTVAIAAINITLFALGGALASFTLSLGVGFALFAVISVIRLRSDTAGWIEMSYLLVGLAIGLILGLPTYSLQTQVLYAGTLILALLLIDNPKILPIRGRETMTVTIDFVETDTTALRQRLNETLKLEVADISIKSITVQPPQMKLDIRVIGL